MTEVKLYSIFDMKSRHYQPPVACINDGHAWRMFAMHFQKGEVAMYREFPEDFEIYRVGTFDEEKGLIMTEHPPVHVANGIELVKQA